MQSHPHAVPSSLVVADAAANNSTPCPVRAAVKARAKALKKWRKQERMRLFIGWCASWHALGFSF